jgi:hypothetical protein
MMVRSTARFSRLVLVAPLGIKLRGRDERDIADMHGIERTEYLRLAWAEPAKGEADYTALPDTELETIVRGPRRQLTRGRRSYPGELLYLVKMVYPGSITVGDLGLLLFTAVRQNLLDDLPAPGEGGLDMGII